MTNNETARSNSSRLLTNLGLCLFIAGAIAAVILRFYFAFQPANQVALEPQTPASRQEQEEPKVIPPVLPKSPDNGSPFSAGEVLIFWPTKLPATLFGMPVPGNQLFIDRFEKLVIANDFEGMMKESGGVRLLFLRAHTKVKLIDPSPRVLRATSQPYVEIRILSGALMHESAFVPISLLGRESSPPKDVEDISEISQMSRRKVFDAYFSRLNTALAPGAKNPPMFDRLQFEMGSMERMLSLTEKDDEGTKLFDENKIKSVIWYGLSQKWPYSFKDY